MAKQGEKQPCRESKAIKAFIESIWEGMEAEYRTIWGQIIITPVPGAAGYGVVIDLPFGTRIVDTAIGAPGHKAMSELVPRQKDMLRAVNRLLKALAIYLPPGQGLTIRRSKPMRDDSKLVTGWRLQNFEMVPGKEVYVGILAD